MKLLQIVLLCFLLAGHIHSQTPTPSKPRRPQEIVYVLGEVRLPQVLRFTPDLTLDAAISNAGGVGDLGATRITLIRGGSTFLKTDTRRVATGNRPDDMPLQPGDVVYLGSISEKLYDPIR